MGATQKVFDNPQHEYTKMLLTAVPQLHKKWEGELGAGTEVTGAISQDEDGGRPGRGRPGRYSKSSLHPLAGMRGRKGRRAQQVATERELAAGLLRTDTYLRIHEEVPPLVEIEDDHFVASSTGAR
jgi:ABC-type glutathione transport system ATPase component